ncbi:uncharacterized protein LOC130622668 [Hydractinia symbiolongicarpus]|uniref:uncharacterized protein LOC130622668 n=1 Tax=Hydractinia symbiolongicarpus TaxID=13093 RepID=UPI00254E92FE|nr:uncharacterized protein LOC130622668 [Hydractinia symbiolongicarpus]
MFSFSAAMFVYFVLFIFQTVDAVKLSSSDVIVRCHDNKMVVTIEREKLEDKNNNVFAFSDANCQAESNKTHFVATAAFDRCGTVTHKEKNGVKHKNILREITPKTNDKKLPRNHTKHYCPFMDVYVSCWIPLKSRVRVPRNIITTTSAEKVVTCREKIGVGPQIDDGILKRARLSSINSISTKLETIACPMLIGIGEELEPDRVLTYTKLISTEKVTIKRKMVNCKPLERTSKFNIQMSIYSDATYTELLLLQEKAKRSDRYDDVYYEISIKDHLNLNIVPTTCYATPYPDPSTKMKYTFVKDGCSLDETYKLYPSFNGKVRFSITSFKFLQSASETFYVHCSVVVCEKESGGKTCNVGCNDKRARRKIRATNFSTDKIVREKGLSVKDAVKLSSSDVIVRCHDNKMVVTIEREKLEDKNNNVFAFSDANCQAESNKTHFVATAAFDRCGTVTHKEKNGVKHKNILREITPKTNDKKLPRNHTKHYCPFMDVYVSCWIPLKSRVRVPRNIITTTEKVVTCREKIGVGPQIDDGILKRARLSSINSISTKLETIACPMLIGIGEELEPDRVLTYTKLISTEKVTIKRKMVNCKPLERTSKFNIQMSIYSDATYTELLLLQEKAKRSDRYDDVYYEISIKDHLNLNIVPTTCYATPYPDPSTKMKYTFVKDGCSLDETYKLYPSFKILEK